MQIRYFSILIAVVLTYTVSASNAHFKFLQQKFYAKGTEVFGSYKHKFSVVGHDGQLIAVLTPYKAHLFQGESRRVEISGATARRMFREAARYKKLAQKYEELESKSPNLWEM